MVAVPFFNERQNENDDDNDFLSALYYCQFAYNLTNRNKVNCMHKKTATTTHEPFWWVKCNGTFLLFHWCENKSTKKGRQRRRRRQWRGPILLQLNDLFLLLKNKIRDICSQSIETTVTWTMWTILRCCTSHMPFCKCLNCISCSADSLFTVSEKFFFLLAYFEVTSKFVFWMF